MVDSLCPSDGLRRTGLGRIAIVTPLFTTADAVSNDVLGMYNALKSRNHDVQVFANEWSIDGIGIRPAFEATEFAKSSDDVLLYHYSMGWHVGLEMMRDASCRRVVKYHNITPPEYFEGISKDYEHVCRVGREQHEEFAAMQCDLYLSDSQYNMWELLMAGADQTRSFVVPPFHHIERLAEVDPDPHVLEAGRGDVVNVLMVGRVAPNKRQDTLIEAFADYHHNFNSASRLYIVGKEHDVLEPYSAKLRELADKLKVRDAITFTDRVTDEQLKAYYLIAKAFVMTSEHEGFCVPLVEAMALKVPVIALASSAVTGTVGKAALLWKERNPHLIAQSIDRLANDEPTAVALGMMGWRRYRQLFTNEKIESVFLNSLSVVM